MCLLQGKRKLKQYIFTNLFNIITSAKQRIYSKVSEWSGRELELLLADLDYGLTAQNENKIVAPLVVAVQILGGHLGVCVAGFLNYGSLEQKLEHVLGQELGGEGLDGGE